ncbi:MAG: hypothetical protein K2M82_06765, partial [Lachnospiraceae bacterium]|nr:hypothetical protein [Lachnospiraceae bacterium]
IIVGFLVDRNKSNKIRNEVDSQFEGRHTADFNLGYIADNKLMLKHRVKGYVQVDLTKARYVALLYNTGASGGIKLKHGDAWIRFYNEKGLPLSGFKVTDRYYAPHAEEAVQVILNTCSWIEDCGAE